jgi:hypothetical protein
LLLFFLWKLSVFICVHPRPIKIFWLRRSRVVFSCVPIDYFRERISAYRQSAAMARTARSGAR